jgi:hypothetical protein
MTNCQAGRIDDGVPVRERGAVSNASATSRWRRWSVDGAAAAGAPSRARVSRARRDEHQSVDEHRRERVQRHAGERVATREVTTVTWRTRHDVAESSRRLVSSNMATSSTPALPGW